MKEDLKAYGNELNYYDVSCESALEPKVWLVELTVSDTTAYVVGQIPLMTLQTKPKL